MDENKEEIKQEEKKEKVNIKREILSWVLVVVAAYLLAFVITHFIIIKTEVISGSMTATLNKDDRVIGNRLAYLFSDPERGDIIFFANPDNETETYVKRVIGLPGDTVEIVEGKVYINGSSTPLDEPYLPETMNGSYGPYVVPEGCFFMMGDNRNESWDSRKWDNTYVTKKQIYAKAWLRYKPSLGLIESAEYGE